MELMVFFVIYLIFWIPSILLLLVGLLSFKLKKLRKVLLILSLISFSIPWILMGVMWVADIVEENSYEGIYVGIDNNLNKVVVEIKDNKEFTILVENCEDAGTGGSWRYVSDIDALECYVETNRVSMYKNYKGELVLNSDVEIDCSELIEVELSRITTD
jgi:hypothetical protein